MISTDSMAAMQDIDTLMARLDAHPESLLFARLADMYTQIGRIDHAVHICEQGLSYRAGYISGHMVMARCYQKIGLLDQARSEYQRVLAMDDEHTAALFQLGEMAGNEQDYEGSLACYRQVLRYDPLNDLARQHIDHIEDQMASRTGHPDADTADPGGGPSLSDDIATATLAEIYAAQGMLQRAIQVLHSVHRRCPDETHILTRIQELEQQLTPDGGAYGHNG